MTSWLGPVYAFSALRLAAHLFFIASDIALRPLALSFLLVGLDATGTLGRPGPRFDSAPPNSFLACCKRDISASIWLMMSFVFMYPPALIIAGRDGGPEPFLISYTPSDGRIRSGISISYSPI